MIVYIIYVVSAINQLIVSGTKPVVSLYATKLGATPAEIGIIVSVFAFLPALLAIHIGRWIDLYGIRRLVSLGGAGLFLSLVAPIVYPHFITFVFSQALMGVAFTFQVVALQKRIGVTGDIEKRIATFSLVASLGAMAGPAMSTFLYEHYSFMVSYAVNSVLMLIGMVIVRLVSLEKWELAGGAAESHSSPDAAGGSVWSMLKQRDLRNAVIISGLMLSNREIFAAYFPLLGEKLNLSPTQIGIILSLMGAASMAIRMTQPVLVRRFGRMNVLTWALYISGVIYLLTPSIPLAVVLTILICILGAGLGLGQPLSLSYTIQVSPLERRGEVLGMRITFNRVSQLVVPLLFGSIGGVAGVTAIFWASGLLLLFGGVMTRAKPAAASET
ncbi:MFS transporter [Paenibacillus hamazuiensis]|uniref:MFS transporter n=1 Tax=Paenibacillus hamazuiensis TaxID=2936508 RepID=UPI00200ECF5F|nr:MFS transporter [Paenibacillus hamazuiensis]